MASLIGGLILLMTSMTLVKFLLHIVTVFSGLSICTITLGILKTIFMLSLAALSALPMVVSVIFVMLTIIGYLRAIYLAVRSLLASMVLMITMLIMTAIESIYTFQNFFLILMAAVCVHILLEGFRHHLKEYPKLKDFVDGYLENSEYLVKQLSFWKTSASDTTYEVMDHIFGE